MTGPTPSAEREDRLRERWTAVWANLGIDPPSGGFGELLDHYRERHRSYHTDQHLAECLDWLDRARSLAAEPEAVALALWYHDAIYRPRARDNEEASAALARNRLAGAGVAGPIVEAVVRLILQTRHTAPPPPGDPALVVDIDLAILGAGPDRYAEYERQVRTEYRWVPVFLFQSRRAALLREFLDRPRLYSTDFFHDRLELAARRNLRAAIAALESA